MIKFRITDRNKYPGGNEYWVKGMPNSTLEISILYTLPNNESTTVALTIGDRSLIYGGSCFTTYHLINPSRGQLRKGIRMAIDHHYEMNKALKEAQ